MSSYPELVDCIIAMVQSATQLVVTDVIRAKRRVIYVTEKAR